MGQERNLAVTRLGAIDEAAEADGRGKSSAERANCEEEEAGSVHGGILEVRYRNKRRKPALLTERTQSPNLLTVA